MNFKYNKEIRDIIYKHQREYYHRNKDKYRKYSKKAKEKAIQEKKYHCEKCDLSFPEMHAYNKHLNSKKHNPEKYIIYVCPYECRFKTKAKTNFVKHFNTKKHKNDPIPEIKPYTNPKNVLKE